MRKEPKFRLPIIIMLISVTACLVLTGFILAHFLSWKAGTKPASYRLENVYITNTSEGKICFLHQGKNYEFDGKLKNAYTGIADVEVKDQKIQKIYTKSSKIQGVLNSYTDDTLQIKDYGEVERNEEISCYLLKEDGTIKEDKFSNAIVGSSRGDFVFANGKVCAVIFEEDTNIDSIRVLLKNGSSVFWDSLYLKGDSTWTMAGQEIDKETVCPVEDYLSQDEVVECRAVCNQGYLYLCNAKGEELKEGYEGEFWIQKTPNGYVLINELPVEDYVRYVLPSEMMTSFSYESLKAQAVCARTFAYTQMKGDAYAEYGANLDDSTAFQVYNASGTFEIMDQAVEDTAGQVLTYDGDMITCYYYSTSPGYTENLEVWEAEDSPAYLKKKNCLLEQKDIDLSDAKTFSEFIHSAPESYDSASLFYRWEAQLSLSDVEDEKLGTLKEIQVTDRSTSGYVTGLTCVYENGSQRISNENVIRQFVGKALKKLTLADGSTRDFTTIPSACFEITSVDGYTVTLTGGGFGHGIGMSQYGASAMGEKGYSYQEILEFYYEGTKVKQR